VEELFETAVRKKFRYETTKGLITTEDLWDMPLLSKNSFNLDILAVSLSNQLEEVKSFVTSRSKTDSETKAKLDIVVHVIDTKLKDAQNKEQAAVQSEKKQRILSILKDKQDDTLKGMSEADLRKELESLN